MMTVIAVLTEQGFAGVSNSGTLKGLTDTVYVGKVIFEGSSSPAKGTPDQTQPNEPALKVTLSELA